MLLAATLAGVGFETWVFIYATVRTAPFPPTIGQRSGTCCDFSADGFESGMSYPISGQNPGHKQAGYEVNEPIIPHGVSMAPCPRAPAVFRFTRRLRTPDRHLAGGPEALHCRLNPCESAGRCSRRSMR